MSLPLDVSQEEAFRLVSDYFTKKRMRISTFDSPSYIRAELGAWGELSLGNAYGEVETSIVKRESRSHVNFNLSFRKEYLLGLTSSIIITILFYVIISIVILKFPETNQSLINTLVYSGILLIFVLIMGGSLYDASATRRKFIEEFNMFIRSQTTLARARK